jgi:teichuronic acid biosynthesis glycosyltransferase TuaG
MSDLISIIIPYYKKKFFFSKTIKSVLRQSYKNFEIILIYDDISRIELKFVNKILKKIKKKKNYH